MTNETKIIVPRTLRGEIRRKIVIRVVTAAVLLISTMFVFSGIEVKSALEKTRNNNVERVCDKLEDFAISQVLVDNKPAVKLEIDRILRDGSLKNLKWEEGSFPLGQKGMRWSFPFTWRYIHPLRPMGNQTFGRFVVAGSLLDEGHIFVELLIRIISVVLLSGFVLLLLVPLAHQIPKELVISPISSIKDFLNGNPIMERASFTELQPIFDEIRQILEDKKSLTNREAEIKQLQTMVQTIQMIAHDIRRPFVLLKRVVDALEEIEDPNQLKQMAKMSFSSIKKASADVTAMMNGIIEIGSTQPLKLMWLNLHDVVGDVISEVAHTQSLGKRNIESNVISNSFVFADRSKLHRALSNLLTNAVEATTESDRIWISTKTTKRSYELEICVGNTGSFIPESKRDQIFELFFTEGKSGGTGLGLAVAKKTAEEHGGSIFCESNLDAGTKFHVAMRGEIRDEVGSRYAGL